MSLYEVSDGRILIGMRYANLVVYTPASDKFEKISFAPEIELEQPPHANNWVRSIAEDRNKRLWAAIGNLGLFQIEGLFLKDVPARHSSWNKTEDPRVLYFDSRNNFWIGTPDGIEWYRPDGSRSTLTEEDGLPDNLIGEIHEIAPGEIWIATSAGACIYDGKTFRYPVLDPAGDDLEGYGPAGPVETVFKARDGKYWATSWSQVTCTKNVEWASKSPLDRAVASVKAQIEADFPSVTADRLRTTDGRGRVWVVVMGRLFRFDGKEWKQLSESNARRPTLNAVKADSQGRVLVCSSSGLWVYEGDKRTVIGDAGTAAGHFYDVAEAPDGVIYAGTQGGLFSLKGNELELLTTDQWYQALSVAVDSTGAVWFAEANAGLHRFQDGQTRRFAERVPLKNYDILALEPLAAGGVTVYAGSESLVAAPLKVFDFDGKNVTALREPNPLLGLDGRDAAGGCVVARVFPRSAAAKARIVAGDVISEFSGRRIGGFAELNESIGKLKSGDAITLVITRKDKSRTITVVLKKWP
jgi:ligand-binding sensor domain-containing protein